jgi:site-specific DNA-methyltransferase (adenine-specific)
MLSKDQYDHLWKYLKIKTPAIFEGGHNIHTPRALVEEIVEKLPPIAGECLALNLEFALGLQYIRGVDPAQITVWAHHPNVIPFATKLGYSVVGQDILEHDFMGKKFDVVIGNPPFQDSTHNVKSHSLWPLFVARSFDLATGAVALVTPASWMSPSHKEGKELIKPHCTYLLDAASYFPGVGSTFTGWVATPSTRGMLANIPLLPSIGTFNPTTLSILTKFSTSSPLLELHSDSTNHSSKKDYTSSPTASHLYEILHTNTSRFFSSRQPKHLGQWKVLFPLSGKHNPLVVSELGNSELAHYYLVSSEFEGERLASILGSTLFTFVLRRAYNYAGILHLTALRSLPALDLTRDWTDEQIYEHFKLTPEEIAYIESTVKCSRPPRCSPRKRW